MTYTYISWFFPKGFQGVIQLITRPQEEEEINKGGGGEGGVTKKLELDDEASPHK